MLKPNSLDKFKTTVNEQIGFNRFLKHIAQDHEHPPQLDEIDEGFDSISVKTTEPTDKSQKAYSMQKIED